MSAPLVSVVMPCYKAERTLEKAVEGVLGQSHTQFELLLLVDGDVDGTLALAYQLAAADARIRLIYSARNRGVIRMRNLGIRLARGGWLAFCDADDWWLPSKLSTQLQLAESSRANVVCSAFYYHYPNRKRPDKVVQLPSPINLNRLLRSNAIAMSTAIFHLESLGRHYFEPMPHALIHEDYAFWLQLFKHKPALAAYLAEPTTYICVQAGSRSSNKWLAMRSHAYVLRQFGGLSYGQLSLHLLAYAYHALVKRWRFVRPQKRAYG